ISAAEDNLLADERAVELVVVVFVARSWFCPLPVRLARAGLGSVPELLGHALVRHFDRPTLGRGSLRPLDASPLVLDSGQVPPVSLPEAIARYQVSHRPRFIQD